MSASSPSAYDQILYPTALHPQTHPERLASMAIVLGMNPAPVTRCRVLELGCGDGLNLTAMAFGLPGSQFVGIDLADRPLRHGRELAQELELGNLSLMRLDIAEASGQLGSFDYIIAHGVYSWIPAPVRDQLLALCAQLLTEQGVAYVSYNAYPGNHLRDLSRRMMRYHVDRANDPAQRINQARALLKFLIESKTKPDAYRLVLQRELDRVAQYTDAVFFHDDLSPINHPVYFHEFVSHAARHGLQYLAEAQAADLPDEDFTPQVKAQLQALKERDLIAGEQYLDFVKCRSFRQTLLCRSQITLDRQLRPERLRRFHLASPARPISPTPDIASTAPLDFSGPDDVVFKVGDPLGKAAFLHLGSVWPRAVPFPELLRQSRAQLNRAGPETGAESERDAHLLGEILGRAHATSFVELYTQPSPFVTEVSERPTASLLARCQLRQGSLVATLHHSLLKLEDPLGRHLVLLLDGTRDRAALLADLGRAVRSGTTPVVRQGEPVTDLEEALRILAEELDRSLTGLARSALLVA